MFLDMQRKSRNAVWVPGECWCYEETIGPGGIAVGGVVKRLNRPRDNT